MNEKNHEKTIKELKLKYGVKKDYILTLNDKAWLRIFDDYDIISEIEKNGEYRISASVIKKYREPRLMAKFDHSINLPIVFSINGLSILPVTRGDYVISHFNTYKWFEESSEEIHRFSTPINIQSIDFSNITSESIAINSAFVSGILDDFLEDNEIVPTVCGRMSSGEFTFRITNNYHNNDWFISVKNSQVEIDAAFEGVNYLSIIEAKRDLSKDFLVRQLYYPYRLWTSKVSKKVKTIFLIYSNGVYKLFEYEFKSLDKYDSIELIKQKNYSVEDLEISMNDLQKIIEGVQLLDNEPKVPFPQADSFLRVINLCEILLDSGMSRDDITEEYSFDVRQTNYYTDACRYLGLLEKRRDNSTIVYELTEFGSSTMHLSVKERNLLIVNEILKHKVFNETLRRWLDQGERPTKEEVVKIMKKSELYSIKSEETYYRRASTIFGWLNWILSIIDD